MHIVQLTCRCFLFYSSWLLYKRGKAEGDPQVDMAATTIASQPDLNFIKLSLFYSSSRASFFI